MFDKTPYKRDSSGRRHMKACLDAIEEALRKYSGLYTSSGLAVEDVSELQATVDELSLPQLPPLDCLTSEDSFEKHHFDLYGNALLRGALPGNGGGFGVALKTTGNGACMMNAICTAAWGKGNKRPNETDSLALFLRVWVLRIGVTMTNQLDFGNPSGCWDFLGGREAYDAEVLDSAMECGMDITTKPGDDPFYEEDVARGLLVIALHGITGEYSEGSIFCLPLFVEALGVCVRCFHPVASINETYSTAVGDWKSMWFGESADAVSIVVSTSFHGRRGPSFRNLQEFKEKVCLKPRLDDSGQVIGEELHIPTMNHFLAICPSARDGTDEGNQQSGSEDRQGAKSAGGGQGEGSQSSGPETDSENETNRPSGGGKPGRPKGREDVNNTQGMANKGVIASQDRIQKSWREGRRDLLYLKTVSEKKQMMPLGGSYNPRAPELLTDDYKWGMASSSLPSSLKWDDTAQVDIDYAKYCLLVEDVGTKVLLHHDTLSHLMPQVRNLNLPKYASPLFLTRGPGLTYVVIHADEEEVENGETTVEEEVGKARDEFLDAFHREASGVALRRPSRPDLICRSHQSVSGMLLQRVLLELGFDVVWHLEWGMKCPAGDLAGLDDAAERARDRVNADKNPTESNTFDVATTLPTTKVPLVTCWPLRNRGAGDDLARRGATRMRCYAQAPGLFHRPFGSTQTRGATPWEGEGVTKLTVYSKWDHVLRAWGKFTWAVPNSHKKASSNLKYLRGMIDELATEDGMTFIKENGMGLRVEARVLAVTAREAEAKVRELGLLDPETAWTELRQYHDRPVKNQTGSGTTTQKHLPLWLVEPEIVLANAMRVVQSVTDLSLRRKPLALVKRAGVDAMAAVGRTHNSWRAYDGLKQKEPSWWVHDHEFKRNVEAATRRRNPSRRARKAAIVEEQKDDIDGDVYADCGEDKSSGSREDLSEEDTPSNGPTADTNANGRSTDTPILASDVDARAGRELGGNLRLRGPGRGEGVPGGTPHDKEAQESEEGSFEGRVAGRKPKSAPPAPDSVGTDPEEESPLREYDDEDAELELGEGNDDFGSVGVYDYDDTGGDDGAFDFDVADSTFDSPGEFVPVGGRDDEEERQEDGPEEENGEEPEEEKSGQEAEKFDAAAEPYSPNDDNGEGMMMSQSEGDRLGSDTRDAGVIDETVGPSPIDTSAGELVDGASPPRSIAFGMDDDSVGVGVSYTSEAVGTTQETESDVDGREGGVSRTSGHDDRTETTTKTGKLRVRGRRGRGGDRTGAGRKRREDVGGTQGVASNDRVASTTTRHAGGDETSPERTRKREQDERRGVSPAKTRVRCDTRRSAPRSTWEFGLQAAKNRTRDGGSQEGNRANVRFRPLPECELSKMKKYVTIRKAPFNRVGVTWKAKTKDGHKRTKIGSGVTCRDGAAVYETLWAMYKYAWPGVVG